MFDRLEETLALEIAWVAVDTDTTGRGVPVKHIQESRGSQPRNSVHDEDVKKYFSAFRLRSASDL